MSVRYCVMYYIYTLGNPFFRSAREGGDVVVLDDQVNGLDWLGATLDKHYGAEESIGYNANAPFKDKLDYVYRVLKNRQEKKYQAIKRVINNTSPDDEDAAYSLAMKSALSNIADKIQQERKKQLKQKQQQGKSKL